VRGKFVIGTLPEIPIPEADFDLCVLSQVLEHLVHRDQIAVLDNARVKVAPDGYLLITTPNRPVSSRMRSCACKLQPIENWLDSAALQALLSQTGWRTVRVSFAFNLFPVLISRWPWLRAARYLSYDLLHLRNIVEDCFENRGWGDTIVTAAMRR